MFFHIAFFSGLLLLPAVLAVPSGLGAGVAHRRGARQSQFNSFLDTADAASNSVYSANWAGAFWIKDNVCILSPIFLWLRPISSSSFKQGTFTSITGTFTVPTPSGEIGSSAVVWVGIDGSTCTSGLLQTGVTLYISPDGPEYGGKDASNPVPTPISLFLSRTAWYEWYPGPPATYFSNIDVSAGDVILLNVTATSGKSGIATVNNLTKGQTASQILTSDAPLCGQNAEWIVEDAMEVNGLAPFADFGTVTFTNAVATGAGTYTPSGAGITNIKQGNKVLTSTSISGSSVTIKYE